MRRQVVHTMYNKNNVILKPHQNNQFASNIQIVSVDTHVSVIIKQYYCLIITDTCVSNDQVVVVVVVSVKITVHNKYLIIKY